MPTALPPAAAAVARASAAARVPVMRDVGGVSRRPGLAGGGTARDPRRADGAVAPAEAARLARLAVVDRRSARDRVLDRVADGLMAELGWR